MFWELLHRKALSTPSQHSIRHSPRHTFKSQEVDGEGVTVDTEGRLFEGHSDEQDDKSEGIGGNDEDFMGKESSVIGGVF